MAYNNQINNNTNNHSGPKVVCTVLLCAKTYQVILKLYNLKNHNIMIKKHFNKYYLSTEKVLRVYRYRKSMAYKPNQQHYAIRLFYIAYAFHHLFRSINADHPTRKNQLEFSSHELFSFSPFFSFATLCATSDDHVLLFDGYVHGCDIPKFLEQVGHEI